MAQSESNEGKLILLLCLFAAIHTFVFSAAFPFFNNVDEQAHFDLIVKYSHGQIPRRLEPMSAESAQYIVAYGTLEYLADFHGKPVPPPAWTQPPEKVSWALFANESVWKRVINWESAQQPLYYVLAGAWWHLGGWCGFEGGHLLYWLRFLNLFFVAALVWLSYVTARIIFPERKFIQFAVPALLAFMPQSTFYSIQNDVLSPLCFGAAFICLMKILRTETPDVRLGVITGLAFAMTFLAKISNLPLLVVSALALSFKFFQLVKTGKFRAATTAILAIIICAGLPICGWLAWCKHVFGNFTGSAAKIALLNWTLKPFSEWWHHPIFTPHGFWTFISGLLATFWQGEFLWYRQPLASPVADMIYLCSSVGFVGVAIGALLSRSAVLTGSQRQSLWFCFGCFAASVAFLGFLSIIYDFGDCARPSRELPYFTSGRMILGALIPFLVLFVYGLDHTLSQIKNHWLKPLSLAGIILFMLIFEIAINRTVFSSQYNWFHM
jgi:hypothetical protein